VDFEKRRKLEEVHKSEHTGVTNRERVIPLSPVKYTPGHSQRWGAHVRVFIIIVPVLLLYKLGQRAMFKREF